MRCSAGKSEPGLTTKVPPVICWILREIPNPCISPEISDFKISKSKVPCKRLVCSGLKICLLSAVYRNSSDLPIDCQYEMNRPLDDKAHGRKMIHLLLSARLRSNKQSCVVRSRSFFTS